MPQPEFKTAREVSEHLLNLTADALLREDFACLAAAFRLPHKVTTNGSETILKTPEELDACFRQTCAHYKSQGVTELHRVCEAAQFHGADRVEATHISHVIAHGETIVPPYPVFSVLERTDGQWGITGSDYALNDDQPQAQALHLNAPTNETALAIYQRHLDQVTHALMNKDFESFQKAVQIPHHRQTETDAHVIETPEEMRATFKKFTEKYVGLGVTDFIRLAQDAYFHSDTEIRGMHESHLIRHGARIIQPYPSRIRLLRSADGIWRETHCANAILNTADTFHLWALVAETPRLPDLNIAPERTPK